MTDTDSTSSPSKYDGYSAYLRSLSQTSQSSEQERTGDVIDVPAESTAQQTPQRSRQPDEHDSDASGSPPLTPSTPPPPPPLPAVTSSSPGFGSLSPVGSFAEAVRPLSAKTCSDDEDDSGEGHPNTGQVATPEREAILSRDVRPPQTHDEPVDAERAEEEDVASSTASSDAPEWEDFMARYWKLPSADKLQIHAHARSIVEAEDFDLKPCPMEPELDDEPFLSPIRTGLIDIDMDGGMTTSPADSSAGISPIKELSNVGLESSRIMAKLHGGEIREEAVSIATPLHRRDPPADTVSAQSPSQDPRFAPPSFVPLQSPNSFEDRRSIASNTNTNKSTSSEPPHAANSPALSQEWPHKISPLPSKTLIHALGPIQTRTSLRSLVMKKWSPAYWMHYGPHTLLLFRSKEQLDDWRYNPYHGKRQREYLIKLRIDFYGEMVAGENKEGSGVLGHRILPVKRKSYGKNETDMYQFKLERWTNLGVSVLAAFASQEEAEVQTLHDTISKILKSCPYGGLRNIDHMLKK